MREAEVDMKNIQFRLTVRDGRRRTIEAAMRRHLKTFPAVMSPHDVSKALVCSINTVYEWVQYNCLFSARVGRKIVIPKDQLIDFLITQKKYKVTKETNEK